MYLAFKQGMDLWGLWIGLTVALVFAGAVGSFTVLKADWDYEVTKVMDRLGDDRGLGNGDESA